MPYSDWKDLPLADQYEARAKETAEMIAAHEYLRESTPARLARWERAMRADLRKAERLRNRPRKAEN